MVVASLRQDRRGCPLPPVRLLIFPSQGVRKISFKQFRKALELLAAEKGIAKGERSFFGCFCWSFPSF